MRFPTVNSFWFFDLKTGGTIIGWFGIFFSLLAGIMAFGNKSGCGILISVLYVLVNANLIYGIVQKKPRKILPALVLRTIVFFADMIILLVVPVGLVAYCFHLNAVKEQLWVDPLITAFSVLGYYALFFLTVLDAYFITVMYSIYKELKQPEVVTRNDNL